MQKLSCKFVFWPGDRYAEARASKEMEPPEKEEVSNWCVLFGQDPHLIDFVSSGGICWLDVPASRGRRLHIRPQVHVPGSGARSSLFGLGIFYSEEWIKESVPWHIHIRSFDSWFEKKSESPPTDGSDLEIEAVGVADLASPQFNLLTYMDSKEIVQCGSYTELLEQTRELVLGRTTGWFSSVGIACNPPVADPKICAHLVARNFHKPGIRPFRKSVGGDITGPASRTLNPLAALNQNIVRCAVKYSRKLSKSRLLSLSLAATVLLLLFVTIGGSFGFNNRKESEEARRKLDAAVNSATVVLQRLEVVLGKINSDIKSLQDIVKNAKQWEKDLASAKDEAEAAAQEVRTTIEEAKGIQSSVNSPEMKDQEKSSPIGTSKNGEEGDGTVEHLPPAPNQVQSPAEVNAEFAHDQSVAISEPNSVDSQKSSALESTAVTLENK